MVVRLSQIPLLTVTLELKVQSAPNVITIALQREKDVLKKCLLRPLIHMPAVADNLVDNDLCDMEVECPGSQERHIPSKAGVRSLGSPIQLL